MTNRINRKARIRAKISGTSARPRVVVFRSNKNFYLQAIDDVKKETLVSASTLKGEKSLDDARGRDIAEALAKKLQAKKIKKIVFDRGGYQYHGKIKQIAEELRKAGLEF